jgi:uroporphyrinogen-III decarboxylase
MDLAEVKARYGDRLALWGGVRVENLVSGTPDDVRADVERAMQAGAPGSGYIFGTTHSVAVGTRYENFMAMLEAYHDWADRVV